MPVTHTLQDDLHIAPSAGRLASRRAAHPAPRAPRYLIKELLRGVENRHHRQATYLHDLVLQDLYALRFAVARSSGTAVTAHLDTLAARVHAFSAHLLPPSLPAYGLDEALRTHVLESAPGLAVRLHLDGGQPGPDPSDIFLLRIVQEALANVFQHAGVLRASVALEQHGAARTLRICDAGAGFDVPRTFRGYASDGRFGLLRASAYARAAGGRLTVASVPGAGTVVSVRVPTLPASDR